uniref:Chemosensory protein 4 n=1 Tax=Monochamus alternatus TaxID=192382 RepID=A0A1I9HZN0_MONAT|nr:chemosensory protein 4 [Monochamus alternatus]
MTVRYAVVTLVLSLVIAVEVQGQRGLTGNNYVERQLLCALDKAPCDNLGRQIKDALPEIIGNNCKSCDQKQMANAKRIARFVQNKYPDVWNALITKYGAE